MTRLTGRPGPGEYSPWYHDYIEGVTEADVLDALERQIDELGELARGVPPARETFRYGEQKWSIRELFGHLVDAERVFGYRAFCIGRGDQTPLPGFDEDAYIARSNYAAQPLAGLVLELSHLRRANCMVLGRIGDDAHPWTMTGTANGSVVSVRALAWIILGHARHHIGVLRERYGVTT